MIKLTNINFIGQPYDILDFKTRCDKTAKNVSTVIEDLRMPKFRGADEITDLAILLGFHIYKHGLFAP